jgi:hypothetical protein
MVMESLYGVTINWQESLINKDLYLESTKLKVKKK